MEAKALTTQDLTTDQDLETSEDLTTDDGSTDVAPERLMATSLVTPGQAANDLAPDGLIADALAAHTSLTADAQAAGAPLTADALTIDAVTIIADAEPVADGLTFGQFGVAEPITAALAAAGITRAFPIQALTLPIALGKHDVIGQARTGTGKTLAFGIPIVQQLLDTPRGEPAAPRALVVVPTRELAIQVAEDLRMASARSDINVVTLYGGRAYEPQIEALATVDVVVGTPGRLLDLSRQRKLRLSGVDVLVLDEADRMLDLGFLPDVEAILALTPDHRQTMLFSATMPSEIVTLARRHLYRPTHIRAEHGDEPAHVPTTDQHVFRAHHLDKIEVLARVLQAEGRGLTIVFCRTRRSCDQVTTQLAERGFAAAAVHGDLGQSQRERALRAFRNGKVDVLVATDVAARGLDVDDVTHVVNNECPEDEKAYLHRIGRTGRAGRTGVAVTFVDWPDMARWKMINDALHLDHPEPIETYSTSPHLFSALRIPAGAGGSLPNAKRGRAGLEAEDLEDIGETGQYRSRQPRAGGRRARGDRTSNRRGDAGSPGDQRSQRGPKPRTRARRRTRGGAEVGAAPTTDGSAESTGAGQASSRRTQPKAAGHQQRAPQPSGRQPSRDRTRGRRSGRGASSATHDADGEHG
jgi:superfamily II DNA/RNA helicase